MGDKIGGERFCGMGCIHSDETGCIQSGVAIDWDG